MASMELPKVAEKYQCDVAYIPNFSLLLWKRIPTIVTIHDLIEFNVPNKFSKLRMMYRKVINPLMVKIVLSSLLFQNVRNEILLSSVMQILRRFK